MKSVRQKRIEDDNNKEWAQVRYSKLQHSDRELPNFDNTQYWHDPNESSSWTTNGTRGVALPDPYYNGQKVSDEYTTPIEDLLMYIGFVKAATIQLNTLGVILTTGYVAGVSALIKKQFDDEVFKAVLKAAIRHGKMSAEDFRFAAEMTTKTAKEMALGMSIAKACIAGMFLLMAIGLIAGNTYREIYDAWNSFEQDSINAQNKVDTEGYYDDEGTWHWSWSGYKVVYNIDYGNTTTTQSSAMKLFKYHQLKRGRYQSKAYSKSNVVYTFNYTKSITYIPA